MPQEIIDYYDELSWTWWVTQNEKYNEIKGIYETLTDTTLTLPKMQFINTLFELDAWCTAVIAKQTDGTILHSRTLDYADLSTFLRELTYVAKFT